MAGRLRAPDEEGNGSFGKAFRSVGCSTSEDGDSIDTSNDQGDRAGGEDPKRPTLPEDTTANTAENNGPGNAAPSPEEDEKMQEEALEQAAHHTRTEMPPALGGQ